MILLSPKSWNSCYLSFNWHLPSGKVSCIRFLRSSRAYLFCCLTQKQFAVVCVLGLENLWIFFSVKNHGKMIIFWSETLLDFKTEIVMEFERPGIISGPEKKIILFIYEQPRKVWFPEDKVYMILLAGSELSEPLQKIVSKKCMTSFLFVFVLFQPESR